MFKLNEFRVREDIMGDGKSRYYPEERHHLFFWKPIKEKHVLDSSVYDTYTYRNYSMDRLEHANEYILRVCKMRRSKVLSKREIHPFIETFEILRKK